MSRAVAIFLCIGLIGLVVLNAATEQRSTAHFDSTLMWVHSVSELALVWGLVAYCGFAAIHSTQYISCPLERSTWLIVTIGINLLGSCIYYCTTYQQFRRAGCGALISRNKYKQKEIEQTDAANRHPSGTSGMSPANPASRTGDTPEASGDS